MNLKEYFEQFTKKYGVLATADEKGKTNAALFATPHVFDDENIGFIMPDRLTHSNLQSNPHAAYLFMEDEAGFKGIRLYITKIKEEKDSEFLYSIRRRRYGDKKGENDQTSRFLVIFKIDEILPLVSSGKCPVINST